ncbi:serine/threonine-protein kinase [Saccharothrix sp.]|uniref:serine/threonine-protein kinase n=1 Tax=Saccharothrix sp. TaxID=1873460 RepID=UPI002810E060|nr:serine/threonine-protein kinase [Saccharothrix sp.]
MAEVGGLVVGRYRVVERIGVGGMGVVWRAFDERLGRTVALKQVVVPAGVDAGEVARRAAREGRIAARIQHPNAVTVHDVVEDDGAPVLVMEYVPAAGLSGRVLPPEQAREVGAQVADALAAAHAAGIVHRDVKPGNILLGEDGTAKITDFGIARAAGDVTVTRTGLLAGTPAFLAPEVAQGAQPGPASDVFSLGSTLYAMVEGTPPFGDGDNAIALLHAVAAGRFAPPRRAGPLTPVLLDMLRTDPAARPTMAQVAQRLRAAPTRLDLHPTPPLPPRRANRAVLIGVAALAVMLVVVAAVLLSNRAPDTTTSAPTPTTSTAAVTPERLQRAVADYYALLPADTEGAWARLGPRVQAQGRDQYDEFWKRVKKLRVSSPPQATGPDTVTVGLEYEAEERGWMRETHQLRLIERDGGLLIDADELVSSQRLEGGGKEDEKRKKEKEEEKNKKEGDG